MSRLHSFAKASKTGSHSGGGGSSSFGTSWVARFAKVARNAATGFARIEFFSADQQHHVNQVLGSCVDTLAPRQRVCVQLFRKLLFWRNHRERRRFHSTEPEPIFTRHYVQWLQHFVADTNVHVKAREVSSVHSCLDRIPASASGCSLKIFSCFAHQELEEVVEGRCRCILQHGAHLLATLVRVLG